MRVIQREFVHRFRVVMSAVMVLLGILLPTGLVGVAQGNQGVTSAGSTVSCMSAFAIDTATSQPELLAFLAVDQSAWLYVQEGPYSNTPYAQVESFQSILDGTPSPIMEGRGVHFGGVVTGTGATMIVHQRYSDGTNGMTLIIMANVGGLAAAMQRVQQDCAINGVPLLDGQDPLAMAGTVPGEGGAPATTTQPAAGTTNTTTQPATGTTTTTTTATNTTAPAGQASVGSPATFEVAGNITLQNGTAVGWSNYWTAEQQPNQPQAVTLKAPTGFDMFYVQDYGSHMTLEATWETTKNAFSNGGIPLDEGQSPDGGYYGIWSATAPDGSIIYIMARAMYAPGTTTPTSTGFYAFDYLLDPMLMGIDQVSINGYTAWADLDDNTLRAIFQSGGPTGAPLFLATAPATTQQTTQPGTAQQPGQPATTTTTQPAAGSGQTAPPTSAQYTSPQFGFTVSWAGGWTELVEARRSDTVNGVDGLGLYTGTPGAGAVTIAGMNPGTWTPQAVMDYWLSPAYLAENHPVGTTVVLSRVDATRGGVVLVGPFSSSDPEIWVTVLEATFVNGQLEIDVTFSAPRLAFEAVYADAQRSVLVNGMPVVGLFTSQEIVIAAPGQG